MERLISMKKKVLFPGCEMIRRFVRKTTMGWGNCALVAKLNQIQMHGFALCQEKCALLYENRCFECLSPRTRTA